MSVAGRQAMIRTFKALGGRCPQCGVTMNHIQNSPQCATADHILPKRAGGRDTIHDGVRNLRPMCQECNELIDQCGQCIGALAAVRAVGPVRETAKAWRMSYVAETVRAAA